MFKQFYFFLVSNAERGVAFSAEGFLYGLNKSDSNYPSCAFFIYGA